MRVPVVVGMVLLGLAASAHAAPDVTPLESTPGLSSGFGEFRDAHFHAGLDYSTDDQEGRPVRAVNDGWVERVRASGVGYGRAVYLRLDDGRTVVYGHLSRFAPTLDAFVASRQDSAGVYEQDLWPLPGLLRFRRGEIVAWSGQSGAGPPPHLHFEVRRGDENHNPLLHGFALPDHVPPTLAAAWLTPHGAHARVGGGIDPVRVALRPGAYAGTPPVEGGFDLAVDTWDRADGKPNKLATYRLEARVDAAPVPAFVAVIDSFSWDTTVEVERVYDYAATLLGDDTRRTLAKLPSYRESVVQRGPAVWTLPPGTHHVVLTATDEAGNQATATLVIPVVAAGAGPTAPPPRAPRRRVLEDARVFLRGTVLYAERAGTGAGPAPTIDDATLADSLTVDGRRIDVYAVSPHAGQAVSARFDGDAGGRGGSALMPGRGGLVGLGANAETVVVVAPLPVQLAGGPPNLALTFFPRTFFDTTVVRVTSLPRPAPAGELIPLTAAIVVAPVSLVLGVPCRASFSAEVQSPAIPPGRTGLFLRQEAGWSLIGVRADVGAFRGSTRRLGTFAVFADTTAPGIVGPRAGGFHWHRAAADTVLPRLSAVITDRGAGLAPADQSIFVDGRRVPAEYDPEASRLTWYPRAWPAAGRHEVRIEAVDRLGNRSVRVVPLAVD